MVKVTLNDSCSVSKVSYDKVEAAYKALRKTAPEALAALFHACNKMQLVEPRSLSTLNKHGMVNKGGEVSDEVSRIVKIVLRQDGRNWIWTHGLNSRHVSK